MNEDQKIEAILADFKAALEKANLRISELEKKTDSQNLETKEEIRLIESRMSVMRSGLC